MLISVRRRLGADWKQKWKVYKINSPDSQFGYPYISAVTSPVFAEDIREAITSLISRGISG
jgi:hypothetical protein